MSQELENKDKSSPLGPGARLKQARINRNFEIEQIAEKLRLSPQQVKSIERDDFSYVPAIAYAKGHLRLYARLVDLSANEILKAFESLGIKENSAPLRQKIRTEVKEEKLSYYLIKWSWLLGLLLIVLLVIWWFTHRHAEQDAVETATTPAVSTSETLPLTIPSNNTSNSQTPLAPVPQPQTQASPAPVVQPSAAPVQQPQVNTRPTNQGAPPQYIDRSAE